MDDQSPMHLVVTWFDASADSMELGIGEIPLHTRTNSKRWSIFPQHAKINNIRNLNHVTPTRYCFWTMTSHTAPAAVSDQRMAERASMHVSTGQAVHTAI